MRKVIFFTQNRWAFGNIHHALCKELFKYNIYAQLLDWTIAYTPEEFQHIINSNDYIVTMPDAVYPLAVQYNVPPEKIIAVSHGWAELNVVVTHHDKDIFGAIHKYAVVCDWMRQKSHEYGIPRDPSVVRVGVHFDNYYAKPSEQLRVVGYGGAKQTTGVDGTEIKRGYLVESAINAVQGVDLTMHKFYNHICMPGYYKSIDGIVVSSTEETVGLPAMEAASAGRLVISTPIGYFAYHGPRGGGIVAPVDPQQFVDTVYQQVCYYRDNPQAYREKCESIQQYARETYDWSVVLNDWLELLA